MAGIKETPTNFRVYYTSMKNAYTQRKEEATGVLKDLTNTLNDLYNTVVEDYTNNKEEFAINPYDYSEFVERKYINGQFLRVAKGILINRKGNYELIGRNFDIYKLAKVQKDIYEVNKDLVLYNKLLALSLRQYNELIKIYYNTVHEKMIIDGYGYVFDGNMGWICINRCKLNTNKQKIDYKATKERRAQLEAEGKRIYNQEEANWCAENGIEYVAEDARVYQNIEHVYEIPLIGCKLPNGSDIKFQTSDFRSHKLRGKTNKDILIESGGDKHKICQYDLDIRTKLYICLEADKILYTKFIRNENQEASTVKSSNRKG